MVQRLSISISDHLSERLQGVKESIKVSKICQDAIRQAVIHEETKKNYNVDSLVQRLKKEKIKLYKPFKEEGYRDGMKDAFAINIDGLELYNAYENREIIVGVGAFEPEGPYLENTSNIIEFMDSVGSTESYKKYALLEGTWEHDDINDINDPMNFYNLIKGDKKEKGFVDENNKYLCFSLENREYAADEYLYGWIDGVKSVLDRVKNKI